MKRTFSCAVLWSIACAAVVMLAAAPEARAGTNPFQRNLTFRNELPIPIYPVIQAPNEENCKDAPYSTYRMVINAKKKGEGIPPGGQVKVRIPMNPPCWYSAVRIFVFTANFEQFEALLDPDKRQRIIPDGKVWNPPLCNGADPDACWTGYGDADYGRDAPNQLLEYTIISQDPVTSKALPNPNDPAGIPFVDFDVSYVDDAYLPVAMAVRDGGATEYMGTVDTFADFTAGINRFVDKAKRRVEWSQYAAYTNQNWPNNLFHPLIEQTKRIPSGQILVQETLDGGTSSLYYPVWDGKYPRECSATPACSHLSGLCCPTQDDTFLSCCPQQPYMIENVIKDDNGIFSNKSLTSITARWKEWVDDNPCGELDSIPVWPSENPAFDKLEFCRMFRRTVRYVWNAFKDTGLCANRTGAQKDQCITAAIIGFKSDDKSKLNETVQAVQRSVPWGNTAQNEKRYQDDKFLHFWAPYGSPFNLNPFARFVHKEIDAPGAYSFSIDDRYGNFGSRGSGILINVGGSSLLDNKDPFDPFTQFRVSWGPGWDHLKVCGRAVSTPGKLGSNVRIAFWKDGVKQTTCDVFAYADAEETQFVTFRIGETTKTVTDTYTGDEEEVREMTIPDAGYCAANSTPALVAAGKCDGNLSFPTAGDESYPSLSDADKPRVTWNIPALN